MSRTAAAAQAAAVGKGKPEGKGKLCTCDQLQSLREPTAGTAGLLQCLPEPGPDVLCCGAASSLLPKHCPGSTLLVLTFALLMPGLDDCTSSHLLFA